MSAALAQWWRGLSRREHMLLGVAGMLTAAVLVWAMIWGPLAMGYAQVDADYRAAVARQARVTAKVDLLAAPVDAAASNVPVDALARDSAAEIGITLDRNDPRPPGRTTVAIAAIRSQALLPWLDSLERQGVVIDQLTVTPSPDRTLSVVADLRRAP